MLENFILGGLGAILGAFLRSLLSDSFNKKDNKLPWGTILANHIGCLMIGIFLMMVADKSMSTNANTLLAGGFCGGLTTFSTFSLEYLKMGLKGDKKLALAYCLGSVITCLFTVYLGTWFYLIFRSLS